MTDKSPDFQDILKFTYEEIKRKGDEGPIIPNVQTKIVSFMKEIYPEIDRDAIERAGERAAYFFVRGELASRTQEGRARDFARLEKTVRETPYSVLDIIAVGHFYSEWQNTVVRPFFKGYETAVRSGKARAIALKKHENSPKSKAKEFVRERWEWWQANPSSYKGKASFARDMLDKQEDLISEGTIKRWCLEWEQEGK